MKIFVLAMVALTLLACDETPREALPPDVHIDIGYELIINGTIVNEEDLPRSGRQGKLCVLVEYDISDLEGLHRTKAILNKKNPVQKQEAKCGPLYSEDDGSFKVVIKGKKTITNRTGAVKSVKYFLNYRNLDRHGNEIEFQAQTGDVPHPSTDLIFAQEIQAEETQYQIQEESSNLADSMDQLVNAFGALVQLEYQKEATIKIVSPLKNQTGQIGSADEFHSIRHQVSQITSFEDGNALRDHISNTGYSLDECLLIAGKFNPVEDFNKDSFLHVCGNKDWAGANNLPTTAEANQYLKAIDSSRKKSLVFEAIYGHKLERN